jgi:hypothetical protein
MSVTYREAWEIGTSGPIDADGGSPQRARRASSIGFGREGAICEYIEIMQILPGSSDDALLICIAGVWQYHVPANGARGTENTKFEPPHAEQRDRGDKRTSDSGH